MPAENHIAPVALDKAIRLINHGPTVLVSASHGGVRNVMAAAWACALDWMPPKLTVVLDKAGATRALIERSGHFVVQVPTAAQAALTRRVGQFSLNRHPDKPQVCQVPWLAADTAAASDMPADLPLVAGCAGWLACRLLPEPHNQQVHDLFIGEITAAWADERAFRQGHWQFETAAPEWRTLHYVAGGHFYTIGQALDVPAQDAPHPPAGADAG